MTSFDPAYTFGFFMDDFSLVLLNIITPVVNVTVNITANTSNITPNTNTTQNNQPNLIILPSNISAQITNQTYP